jgi:hypothetical protein
MATLERQLDDAADRYLKAPAELMPRLEERMRAMRKELEDLEARATRLATDANEGAVANFSKWWAGVRDRLLPVVLPPGVELAEPASGWYTTAAPPLGPGLGAVVLAEPAALRALLVRLGVKVTCTFTARDSIARLTPGRGRGPKYVLSRAVMSLPGGKLESETAAGGGPESETAGGVYQ